MDPCLPSSWRWTGGSPRCAARSSFPARWRTSFSRRLYRPRSRACEFGHSDARVQPRSSESSTPPITVRGPTRSFRPVSDDFSTALLWYTVRAQIPCQVLVIDRPW